MKGLRSFLLLALSSIVVSGHNVSSDSESGGIIVQGTNSILDVPVSSSAELNAALASIAPRFLVEHANSILFLPMSPYPADLQTLLEQIQDRIVIQYAQSNSAISLAYPTGLTGDMVPPQISEVTAVLPDTGVVKITWFTDEFASSVFEWGLQSGSLVNTITEPQYFKLHEVNIPGLSVGQTIYYRMRHTDRSGNTMQSGVK